MKMELYGYMGGPNKIVSITFMTRRALGLFVFAIALTWAVVWPLSPAVQHGMSRDAGAFLYVGWRWAEGEIPYRDVWDHKPPGIYLLNRLGLEIAPHSLWGVWAIEWLSLFAAVVLSLLVLRAVFDTPTALVTTFLWAYAFLWLSDGGNLTQEYALPWQFLAVALPLWLGRGGEKARYLCALGLGLTTGIILMLRQNSVGLALLSSLGCWFALPRPTRHVPWKRIAAWALGLALVLGVTVFYFWRHEALYDFWDQVYYFNMLYARERTLKRRIIEVLKGLNLFPRPELWVTSVLGYVVAVRVLLVQQPKDFPRRYLAAVVLLGLPLEGVLLALPGRGRVPYFTAMLPIFALASAFLIALVFDRHQWPRPWLRISAVAFVLLTLVVGYGFRYKEIVETAQAQVFAPATLRYLRLHTTEDDTVLVFGAEPEINFLARRRSPTRFVYQYALYRRVYAGEALLNEFYEDIWRAQPKVIIVAMETEDGSIPDHFGPNTSAKAQQIARQLRARYRRVGIFDGWVLYQRNDR